MKIRLPELEDYAWFPPILRRMQMDFIGWLVEFFQVYRAIVPQIKKLSKNNSTWIDLCSGSGKPVSSIDKHFDEVTSIILTDLYPSNVEKTNGRTRWIVSPIDTTKKLEVNGFRTMFNAFHHFDTTKKIEILQNHGKHGILIAEILEPNIFNLIKIIFTTTIGQLLFRPFVKPFSISGIFFTYIVPINLLTVTWDGIASVLKSSNQNELKAIAQTALPGFTIETGKAGKFGMKVIYLLVHPKNDQ